MHHNIRRMPLLLTVLFLTIASLLPAFATEGGTDETRLILSLVGDCTIGEQEQWRGYDYSFTGRMKDLGMEYPFSGLYSIFSQDDMTLANCENVFTERKKHADKKTNLRATPEWAQVLALGSVEVVNRANNHMGDYLDIGIEHTKEALDDVGVAHFGQGDLCVYEVKGIKIGMTGYTYPHREKIDRAERDIATLREMGCDLVIVSMHWGKELSYDINSEQRKLGPALIDAGADVVYGHGPHVLQPIEIYNGKPIFYSLANFVFGADVNPKDADTVAISLEYDLSGDTPALAKLTAIPCKMHNNRDYRPYILEEAADRARVFKKLVFTKKNTPDSNLPEAFLETGIVDFTME